MNVLERWGTYASRGLYLEHVVYLRILIDQCHIFLIMGQLLLVSSDVDRVGFQARGFTCSEETKGRESTQSQLFEFGSITAQIQVSKKSFSAPSGNVVGMVWKPIFKEAICKNRPETGIIVQWRILGLSILFHYCNKCCQRCKAHLSCQTQGIVHVQHGDYRKHWTLSPDISPGHLSFDRSQSLPWRYTHPFRPVAHHETSQTNGLSGGESKHKTGQDLCEIYFHSPIIEVLLRFS